MASIIYVSITSDKATVPTLEADFGEGRFQPDAAKVLENIISDDSRSYSYKGKFVFHYHNHQGFTYLCLADVEYPTISAHIFLHELMDKFVSDFDEEDVSDVGNELNNEFKKDFLQLIDRFNKKPKTDLSKLPEDVVEKIKAITVESIDSILDGSENSDTKDENIDESTKIYANQVSHKHKKGLNKNLKITIMVSTIVTLNIFFLLALICGGFSFKNCT